ncbi:MAG: bifunctional acetate--CoA ligase family protein/GNAT family N-acetyltransferase [Actinomycetota bacterium]
MSTQHPMLASNVDEETSYPSHREADVVLRDGSTVHVRPIRVTDREALLEFMKRLSLQSVWLRFFSGAANLERVADWAIDVDYRDRYGLITTVGSDIVGHASYIRTGPERAELAFEVADALQGRGVATILLTHLAEAAASNGIHVFAAEMLPENHAMLDVFRESGFPVEVKAEPGLIKVEFPASLTPEAVDRFERREQIASVNAMRSFFVPRSVAVLGASRRRDSIGGSVFHNLINGGFAGPVYPVNPKADVVQSVAAYPSVTAIEGPVDLGVCVVPATGVLDVARECAEKGVRSLVVISSGFAEVGPEGTRLQVELLKICRDAGMRLIGPNCMGIINTAPDVNLHATFAPQVPLRGSIGFMSQSGALGIAVIDHTRTLGLGLSSFVSVGNKADISGNDLIQYWETDDDTRVILLYLESFGNPRKFARIARRVGRTKPIIAVKAGRSAAGARATSSHTGALLAASDVTVDALFRQAGVIRTDTLKEMFDIASLLANQPPPRGKRVGILTNGGGLGILCADACEAGGLEVPPLPEATREKLASFLPAEASFGNPVDMIASASAEDYRKCVEVLAQDGGVDAIIVIFIPPLVTKAEDVARAIREAAASMPTDVPLLTVFMSGRGVPAELSGPGVGIPSFAFPEDAAHALVRAVDYGTWRASDEGKIPTLDGIRRHQAAALVADGLAAGEEWLPFERVAELLDCYGIALPPWRMAKTPKEAGEAGAEISGAVALKAIAPTLLHKTDASGVKLGLRNAKAVEQAATKMRDDVARAGYEVDRFLVQQMAPSGIEMLVGVVHDASFGPVVACAAGGTAVELLNDAAVRITPLTDRDVTEMVHSLKTFPLLRGYRGAPPGDVDSLEQLLLRVSAMVENHPSIAEMDLNPVTVLEKGAVVLDARIRLEEVPPEPPAGARRNL